MLYYWAEIYLKELSGSSLQGPFSTTFGMDNYNKLKFKLI
jgi:hypothetical protein